MPDTPITGALLLAAGRSERFGPQNKLLAPVAGEPMVRHALRLLRAPGIAAPLVVASAPEIAAEAARLGLEALMLPPGGPQSESLRAGLGQLRARGIGRLLVLLADMPFLTDADVARVLTAPPGQAVSAELDGAPLPPALFPAALFARLEALSDDRGAGAVLRALPGRIAVPVPPAHLRDIDLRSDLGGMC